jgi:hypothetical protein
VALACGFMPFLAVLSVLVSHRHGGFFEVWSARRPAVVYPEAIRPE